MSYKAPEVEHLERAVEHIKKNLIPEHNAQPHEPKENEEDERDSSESET